MSVIYSILAFAFTLGVIVLLHELGHYVVAKFFGVRVLTFSVGFGKRVWGFTRGGTDYRLSALPLGGYVRMGGELAEESTGDPSDFVNKPRWQRILIYLAGPFMNLVLSVGVLTVLFMIGTHLQGLSKVPPVVGFIEAGSPGEKAGLQLDDRILAVDGKKVEFWTDFDFVVATAPERKLALEIERQGQKQTLELVPLKVPRDGYGDSGLFPKLQLRLSVILDDRPAARAGFQSGDAILRVNGQPILDAQAFINAIEALPGQNVEIEIRRHEELMKLTVLTENVDGKGKIGVQLGIFRQLPFGEAIVESVRYNIDIVKKTLAVIHKLFIREIAAKSALSGPVEIVRLSGDAAEQGLASLFGMIAFLSISIGILNLLPIPLLDGGQIMILLIESFLRRDLPLRTKERLAQAGFMILMVLMAMVTYFDLSKNLPSLFGG